jgi:hypothetical protein
MVADDELKRITCGLEICKFTFCALLRRRLPMEGGSQVLKEDTMSKLMRVQFVVVFAMTVMFAAGAQAQVSSTSGSAATSWGGWNWQADRAPVTTTVTGTGSFNTPPGLVQIPVTIASGTTVHEVHGNFTLATWQSGSCGNGSIIAQLLDQNNNAIAAVKLQQFGPGTTNVPINGTFSTPLSVGSFTIQYFVDLCGPQTVSFSLVMS